MSGSLVKYLDEKPDEYTVDFKQLDRAATDGASGFITLLAKKGTDRIVAATVVGQHAGEMIGAISITMTNRVGLRSLRQPCSHTRR